MIAVYVPDEPQIAAMIDTGSAIVGSESEAWLRGRAQKLTDPDRQQVTEAAATLESRQDERWLVIDYEGNRFGAANMVTFADRCLHAAGRHLDHYPTVARKLVPRDAVTRVGTYDPVTKRVEVCQPERLAEWLGGEVPAAELETSGGVR